MSPEQASGHLESTIDGRADLYSLGLVFYEMLTGAHPFQSDTPMGMLIQQLHTLPAPPDSFPIHIPAAISALVLKALQKEPKDRFQSASEMLEAMRDPEAWYASIGKQAPRPSQPGSTPAAPISSAAAVMQPAVTPTAQPAQPQTAPSAPVAATPPLFTPTSIPTPTQAPSSVQVPFAPVVDPSSQVAPPPSVATTPPPTTPPTPAPFVPTNVPEPLPQQAMTPPVKKKSNALLFVGIALAVMLLLVVGLFFGYRTIMSRFKTPEQATATTPTPPPAGNQASDNAANVTKLIAMGNDSLASKQYEVAATFFQQALNFDPQNAEAKAGLETAHNGAAKPADATSAKPAVVPPVLPSTSTKEAPSIEKPKPVKTGPVKVPSAVMFAKLVSSPPPVYPPVAKNAHIQGEVTLHAIISKTGTVKTVEPVSGLKIFHESAINAVQQWRYTPYLVNNVPTEVDTTITVNYAIAKK